MKTLKNEKTETKKGVVPKLRFPEFKQSSEWSCNRFEQIYELKSTNSFTRDDLNYEAGSIKNIHYGDIHTKFATLFSLTKESVPFINESESLYKIKPDSFCQESDMVFADASEDMADIGKSIELIDLNNEKLVSGLHTILARQINEKLVKGFGGHLFRSAGVRKQIQREAQGAKVLGISSGRLSSIIIPYPENKKEQSRIADCLSTLDSLIAAHTQKLDGLKSYKKGLMQQLFPAKGEKVPKLRFPEFRKSGEWEEKTFGGVATFFNGRAYKQDELLEAGKYRVLRVGNFFTNNNWYYSDLELEDNKFCDKGDLLYAWSASFGPRIWNEEKVIYHYHIWKVVENDGVNKDFLYILLDYETERMKSTSANGLGLMHITKGAIESWKCYLPKLAEQQRIASFLSSIDNLITAQSQKIESLKIHKKGLMQQLFPAMEGNV